MAASSMTPRERWLHALRLEPVDRLPFWPKLNGAYPRAQPEPFGRMSLDALHAWIGSDNHVGIGACVRETRTRTAVEVVQAAGVQRTLYHTPYGDTELMCEFDDASQSWHPVRFPVRSVEDIRRMTALYEDVVVEFDAEAWAKSREQAERVGAHAGTHCGVGESALMHWVEWLAGVEQAHYLLSDCRAEVEALFRAIHRVLRRRTEILTERSPADMLYLTENTSTTLISPDQYRTYCFPAILEYAQIARAAGKPLLLHMCGHLKALLPDLARLPVAGFEAFTAPTLGNTTLLDGRSACPDKCLIGGTQAMLWTQPARAIIARLERDLGVLPHHRGLVITSAGVMPPRCRPETIREVCRWVQEYPARMN
jgi:hypothetical protein